VNLSGIGETAVVFAVMFRENIVQFNMKISLFWVSIATFSILDFPFASLLPADAAIRPLSDRELRQMSDYIVTADVLDVKTAVGRDEYGSTYVDTARIKISALNYSRANGSQNVRFRPQVGRDLEVSYNALREPGNSSRPTCSPGQSPLGNGMKVKVFLKRDNSGKFTLLEPNGWQRINNRRS
jgi:hypothetical protein